MELCVTAVKFARKQGNIALASRLLGQCCEPHTEHPEGGGDLLLAFRMLSLDGPVKEKWGPELEIEKAKVLFTAGQYRTCLVFKNLIKYFRIKYFGRVYIALSLYYE